VNRLALQHSLVTSNPPDALKWQRGGGRETVTPLGFQARTSAWVSVRRSIEPEQSQGPLAKPDFARTGRDGHAFYWHRRIQGPAGRSCPATAESFFVARTDAVSPSSLQAKKFGIAAAIAVEATGGFERIVAAGLASANLPVVIVNPAQVRDFTKALGKRTKTDPIDALVIARFVEATKPPLRPCLTKPRNCWPILSPGGVRSPR